MAARLRLEMKTKPTALDLFCGAGGLSEGLRQAGFNVIGAVDNDPFACKTYKLNHGKTKLWQTDINKLSGRTLMNELSIHSGQLDLLAACPPCQGFSTIRTKNGSKTNRDPRNNLIFEVIRFIRSLRPKMVMLENVPGLIYSECFYKFKQELYKLGYKVDSRILNSAQYGVPQRRKRLVLLASKKNIPKIEIGIVPQRTVRHAIGRLPSKHKSNDPLHCYSVRYSDKVKQIIRNIPKNGGSRISLGRQSQLPCHMRVDGFKDVYGRMSWDKPAPTITGGCINPSKGRFLHPSENRAISLREAAILQTFPLKYCFSLERGRYTVALLIGNALPPELIKQLGVSIKRFLG